MVDLDRHYCSTTYILSKTEPKTLLHFHKKLRTWLPPGGHVEKNESPREAAIREVIEETSLRPESIEFISFGDVPTSIDNRAKILPLPHLLLEEMIEEDHYHLDWIFYARINPDAYILADDDKFRWFNVEDLENEVDIFENVRYLAIKGIHQYFNQN